MSFALVFVLFCLAVAITIVVVALSYSVAGYSGPRSDHFDGARFFNRGGIVHGLPQLVRWVTNRDRGPWRGWIDDPPGPPPPDKVAAGEIRVTYVNHATLLVQIDGMSILTDPVWSYRVSPLSWAGPRRHRDPGIRFEDLPQVDAVVVSHNHYDHMDVRTLGRLHAACRPAVFSGLGNAEFLATKGIDTATDLDWWEEVRLTETVTITCVPSRHFSSRGPSDRDRALWCGFVIRGKGGSVYFAGDTAYGDHFAEIGKRAGPIRLALLPIGAFRPEWFMSPVHIGPRDAIRAAHDLRAEVAVPMHYGTFPLGDDGETEAIDRLKEVLASWADPKPRFEVLGFGEGRTFSA